MTFRPMTPAGRAKFEARRKAERLADIRDAIPRREAMAAKYPEDAAYWLASAANLRAELATLEAAP